MCFFCKNGSKFWVCRVGWHGVPFVNVSSSNSNGHCSLNQKYTEIYTILEANATPKKPQQPSSSTKASKKNWHESWTWRQKSFWERASQLWEMRRSPSLHWSPSGGCWGGATLSVCPGKVGGEWLAEVYGDLWPLPLHLIASSSVGSRGRPMESFDQHQGSCRWAHQIRCLLRLITETNGVMESSATRRHTRISKTIARRQTAGQWKGLGLQLGLQVGGREELWELWLYWCLSITEKCCDEIVRERNI